MPHFVTSNRFVARTYAKLVQAYLSECGGGRAHVVELGSGTGRFAYHFLTALPALGREVTYVLTDFCESTVEQWQAHPYLRSLADAGALDFARFDAAHPGRLELVRSGEVLTPEGPLVVLANYVFDSIPHDCFAVRDGRLLEGLASITAAAGTVDSADVDYEYVPVRGRRYADRHADDVLRAYRSLGDTAFYFPTAALDCIRHFGELTNDRLLVLSADKGYSRAEQLHRQEPPEIARHGSVSLMVNYHAIGEYVRRAGGKALHPPAAASHLTVAAYLFGEGPWTATCSAYDEAVGELGPDAFFSLKKALEPHYATCTVAQLLALLRLSAWDAHVFLGLADELVARADSAPELRDDLRRAAHAVWEGYLPIGETSDLAFTLGLLLCRIDCHDEALAYFERSRDLHGEHPSTAYNIGLCHYVAGRFDQALPWLDEALQLEPALAKAAELRERIAA